MLLPRFSSSLLAATTAALVAFSSSEGFAQEADPVSGDGKGIVGGALLGGEVVTITMGIIGVEDGWPYFVFGGLGAVAGGLGGFAVESADPPAEAPLYMLAGGLTLLVPALVISLNATSQDEPIGDRDEPVDEQPTDEPPSADPGAPPAGAGGGVKVDVTSQRQSAPARRAAVARKAPAARLPSPTSRAPRMTAVDLREGDLALGLPAVSVRPLYSAQELSRYGVPQGTEVRVPVLGASF